jgi:hypothetical protein
VDSVPYHVLMYYLEQEITGFADFFFLAYFPDTIFMYMYLQILHYKFFLDSLTMNHSLCMAERAFSAVLIDGRHLEEC